MRRTVRFLAISAIAVAGLSSPIGATEPQGPPLDVSSVADRPLAAQPGDSLLFVVGDRITTARVDRIGISGRGVRLRLADTRLRGQVGGQPIDLGIGTGRITGRIGSLEVALDVARRDGVLKVIGRFGARAIFEELTPRAVNAEIGPCRYVLAFRRDEYTGQVGCGGRPEPVRLRIPAALVARADLELVALLTAFLAR